MGSYWWTPWMFVGFAVYEFVAYPPARWWALVFGVLMVVVIVTSERQADKMENDEDRRQLTCTETDP